MLTLRSQLSLTSGNKRFPLPFSFTTLGFILHLVNLYLGRAFIKTTYDISLDSQISLLPLGFSQHLNETSLERPRA